MIRMLLKPIVSCLLLLFSVIGLSQKATLKGKLTDADKNESLPFANVIVGDASSGVNTDMDGNYEIMLDPGSHKITYSFVGYDDVTKEVTLAAGEVRVLDVTMGAGAELLEQVIVTTNKSETKIGKSTVSVAVVQPSLIENTNSTAIDEVIEKVPGVNIIDGQANIRGGSGYSFGAGSRVLLLVDDMPFLASDAGFPHWRDVPVENINQIEILKGAASALYGSSALNGIINVRTAYPTSDPVTKVSVFGTYFASPRTIDTCQLSDCAGVEKIDRNWWNKSQDKIVENADGTLDTSSVDSKLFGGELGYNQPLLAGLQFAHRQKFGKFDLVLGGNYYYEDSYRRNEYDRKTRLNANTRYRITDNLAIGVNVNFNVGKSSAFFLWENPYQGAYIPFARFTTASTVFRYNIDPFVTYFDKFGNRHKLLTRYYFVKNDNANNQANKSKLLYGEYQYQRKFEKLDNLGVVAGLVGTNTNAEAQLFGNANYRISNFASFLQLDKGFFKDPETNDYKLNATFGMRYELNTISSPDSILVDVDNPNAKVPNDPKVTESKPVFRLGLNYQPAEYTYLRASWGQGYRFPTIAEKFVTTKIAGLLSIQPNPELQSERGWSAEIGLKQGVKISSWQGFFDISGFWTEYQEMMEFTFGGADTLNPIVGFQSVNIGNTSIQGFDMTLLGQGKLFGVPVNILTGYTYINPRFKEFEGTREEKLSSSSQNILKYRFRHTFKFDAQAKIAKRLSLGFSVNYNSHMQAVDKFFEEFELFPGVSVDLFGLKDYRQRNNKGAAVMDARIGYDITKNVKLAFIVKNLTNKDYTLRPALMEAPLNFTFRADAKF